MKKTFAFIVMLLLALSIAFATPNECTGAVWTTDKEGNLQDKNHYDKWQNVYIQAQGLDPNAECSFNIIDLGEGQPVVFSGSVVTDANGDIVTPQLVLDGSNGLKGTYKVEVSCSDSCKKSDNFRIRSEEVAQSEVPEFGYAGFVLATGLATFFAIVTRKKF